MKIRVEHAACREAFDHAQLLNAEQHQSRPDVIEKLNCNEQNPQRDSVSFCSARQSNAVMSDKHFRSIVGRLYQTPTQGVSQNKAAGTRATSTGSSLERVSGS